MPRNNWRCTCLRHKGWGGASPYFTEIHNGIMSLIADVCFISLVKSGQGRHFNAEYLCSRKTEHVFQPLKDILHDDVYEADFTELSYLNGSTQKMEVGWTPTLIRGKYRRCMKNAISTVEAMHEYFLSCKHTMSVPQETNDTRVQTMYSVLTHRLGKSLQELMSYKLSGKDCVFCHCIDCNGAETCSRGIKEGHGESTSSEIRQTMNAQSVWKYLV